MKLWEYLEDAYKEVQTILLGDGIPF